MSALTLVSGFCACQVQFTNLVARQGGGALWINGRHQVVIKDSLFLQCSASTGGAMEVNNAVVTIKQVSKLAEARRFEHARCRGLT